MKILLVDDARTMRGIQKRMLATLGPVEFVEAGDGLEALAAIAASPSNFDMMLIDWNMPNMNGLTLVQHIREKDKTTPLIMVTTEGEKARVVDAIRAGINNYVVKPFTSETLLTRVTQTLEKLKAVA